MKTVRGDYGDIFWLSDHLVEVVAKQGIELTSEELEITYERIVEESGGICALLINRVNDYSLTYEAHQKVADNSGLLALAYLTYSDSSALVAAYTAQMAHKARCPIRIFRERETALVWLNEQLAASMMRYRGSSAGGE